MEKQIVVELDAARVAAHLMAAWTSGDRRRLETAVHSAAHELNRPGRASSLETERRELLLSVVESLGGLLRAGYRGDFQDRQRLEVCRQLLRHLEGDGGRGAVCAEG